MGTATLVDWTYNAENKIAKYAAICYDAATDDDSVKRRMLKLLNLGHLATLRFASATFLVEGISRACSHQLVRSKHLDFLQESQRYVNQGEADFVYPPSLLESSTYNALLADAKYAYNQLIAEGIRKEDARYVLPNASTTRLYVTGNFQAWKDFLKNRQDKAAQWEIRDIANQIAKHLYGVAPNIFGEEYGRATAGD